MSNEIEVYKVINGEIVFDVDRNAETLWATEDQVSKLFNVDRSVTNRHIRNIYRDGELDEKRTAKEIFAVRKEGNREVRRKIKVYNLDAIISVGYRVNSRKATDFRIWATRTLKSYLVNGVAVNGNNKIACSFRTFTWHSRKRINYFAIDFMIVSSCCKTLSIVLL